MCRTTIIPPLPNYSSCQQSTITSFDHESIKLESTYTMYKLFMADFSVLCDRRTFNRLSDKSDCSNYHDRVVQTPNNFSSMDNTSSSPPVVYRPIRAKDAGAVPKTCDEELLFSADPISTIIGASSSSAGSRYNRAAAKPPTNKRFSCPNTRPPPKTKEGTQPSGFFRKKSQPHHHDKSLNQAISGIIKPVSRYSTTGVRQNRRRRRVSLPARLTRSSTVDSLRRGPTLDVSRRLTLDDVAPLDDATLHSSIDSSWLGVQFSTNMEVYVYKT